MKSLSIIIILFIFSASCTGTNNQSLEYTTGDRDLNNVLTYIDLEIDGALERYCLEAGEELFPAQTEQISSDRVRIWWLATQSAGETVQYRLRSDGECVYSEYTWERTGDQTVQLQINGQPLIQYVHPVFDYDNIEDTKKPFHHVFDPETGQIITKGPGGLYSHHRGIFFGYNQVEVGGKVLDIWHAREGERSEHDEIVEEFTGPVIGGHIVKINWKDFNDDTMLEEMRDIRVFKNADDNFFIDFHSTLNTVAGPAKLGGDLQHAGVQFRASQYVAEHADETHYIRPPDWNHISSDIELGEEERIGLPWNAMQFNVRGNLYTVAYMSHPENPGGAEMSERRYGRFGEFFPYELTEDTPLDVRYRFWIVAGESPTVNEIQEQYQLYID